jgi:hypothetical protein
MSMLNQTSFLFLFFLVYMSSPRTAEKNEDVLIMPYSCHKWIVLEQFLVRCGQHALQCFFFMSQELIITKN